MKRLVAPAIACLALTAPAGAAAADLQADLPCYLPSQPVALTGGGWTAGAPFTIVGGLEASGTIDPTGALTASATAPAVSSTRRTPKTLQLTASDGTLSATAEISVVNPGAVWQDMGAPRGKVKWSFGGLTPGEVIYVHVRRGTRLLKTTRIGTAAGACGTATKTLRRLPVEASQITDGTFKIYVDTRKRFSVGGMQYAYRYEVATTYR